MKKFVQAVALSFLSFAASAQSSAVLTRAAEIRADKLASSAVLLSLDQGANVRVQSLEGGWALVEVTTPKARVSGWIRASALNLQAATSQLTALSSGREASGNTALTLGVRSIPQLAPRINRHALIIDVGRYADPSVPSLPGTKLDKNSATQMAQAMQVPGSNIQYLQDDQATGENIRQALRDLSERVQDGDRVFIHYSGHGTRYKDPEVGGCVEALLPFDGMSKGMLTNREMAGLLSPISRKTDKLFVMYDACHSGGMLPPPVEARTRGLTNRNDDGALRPKFAGVSEECSIPANVKTRGLVSEQTKNGDMPQDIIHLSAARDNEISFDDEQKGGLATQYMRDCMLRDAKDLDGSGAISIDEMRQCAQEKINNRMKNDSDFKPHNLVLSGNANFVPAWFSQGLPASAPVYVAPVNAQPAVQAITPATSPVAVTQAPAPVATQVTQVATMPATQTQTQTQTPTPTPTPTVTAPAPTPAPSAQVAAAPVAVVQEEKQAVAPQPVSGEQALRQMFDQRNAKRKVVVTLSKSSLVIGKDALAFSVKSERAGYVYVALAGSDGKALYMLFPNDLDQNNKIEAGQTLDLPKANWRIKASGPVGVDQLLVIVSDAPRDLSSLAGRKTGPFLTSLNDANGRAQLGALMSASKWVSTQTCVNAAQIKNNPLCSDAYGAEMVQMNEVAAP